MPSLLQRLRCRYAASFDNGFRAPTLMLDAFAESCRVASLGRLLYCRT